MDLAKPYRYGAENGKIPERYVACICKQNIIPILLENDFKSYKLKIML